MIKPKKLYCLQIKNNLERLRRNIKLRMYFKGNPPPASSKKPAFRVPSTRAPLIRDIKLKFYLSKIEDKLSFKH